MPSNANNIGIRVHHILPYELDSGPGRKKDASLVLVVLWSEQGRTGIDLHHQRQKTIFRNSPKLESNHIIVRSDFLATTSSLVFPRNQCGVKFRRWLVVTDEVEECVVESVSASEVRFRPPPKDTNPSLLGSVPNLRRRCQLQS